MFNNSPKKCASRGAKLLDQRKPGWYKHIRVDGIHMQDTEECILGQLYGDYERGCHAVGIYPAYGRFAIYYGFWDGYNTSLLKILGATVRSFRLGKAWWREIEQRQAHAAAQQVCVAKVKA